MPQQPEYNFDELFEFLAIEGDANVLQITNFLCISL